MIIKAADGPWYEPKEICEGAMDIYRKNCAVFRFVEVEGNHFVHLNDPEQCAVHINQFLSESKVKPWARSTSCDLVWILHSTSQNPYAVLLNYPPIQTKF